MTANILGESYLENITLHLHMTNFSLPHWCHIGIGIFHYQMNEINNILIFVKKILLLSTASTQNVVTYTM